MIICLAFCASSLTTNLRIFSQTVDFNWRIRFSSLSFLKKVFYTLVTLPEAVPPATPIMKGRLKSSPVSEDPLPEDARRSTVIVP